MARRDRMPTTVSGFPEMLPDQRAIEASIIDALRATFELHGFAGLETRAVEPLDVLLAKGSIDHEVYVLQRLQAQRDQSSTDGTGSTVAGGTDGTGSTVAGGTDGTDGAGAPGRGALALHYDLTVPFARYVVENAGSLAFPFRRYQVQKVWRGERPQEGRYREFTQVDIDVVGAGSLAAHHDVEMARVMAAAMAGLPLPPVTIAVNDRRLVEGFHRGLGADDAGVAAVLRAVDKLDKVGADGPRGVRALLVAGAGYDDSRADAALALASITGDAAAVEAGVRALGVEHPLLDEGLAGLLDVLRATRDVEQQTQGRVRVAADLSIARGLDYYTGTVYETRMRGFEKLGSICSGGRYDSLATDGRTTYPGVGISLGLTRALSALLAAGALTVTRAVPSAVLVAVLDEDHRGDSDAVAAALRRRGVAAEVSPDAARLGKQIRHADRRGIPFVWFPAGPGSAGGSGEAGGHEVKDVRSGEQVAADPETWLPPEEDLRPRVSAAGTQHDDGRAR